MKSSQQIFWAKVSAYPYLAGAIVSAFVHTVGFVGITSVPQRPTVRTSPVKVEIVETPKAPEPVPERPKKPDPPKPKPPKPQVATQAKPVEAPKPNVAPVQGLAPKALNDAGTMSAPAGNTLMIEDTGKRLRPEDVQALASDLSADAKLIEETFALPEYTQEALDANLEAIFLLDVYVDEKGSVVEAQLRKKIGYGMDERVLRSARAAKFVSRKNRLGGSIAGWAELRIRLTIP